MQAKSVAFFVYTCFQGIEHRTEKLIYVFPEMKLRGLVPNPYIHVSVSNLYIPRIAQRYMNVEIERQNITILYWK